MALNFWAYALAAFAKVFDQVSNSSPKTGTNLRKTFKKHPKFVQMDLRFLEFSLNVVELSTNSN
jgi:hypothetical protein